MSLAGGSQQEQGRVVASGSDTQHSGACVEAAKQESSVTGTDHLQSGESLAGPRQQLHRGDTTPLSSSEKSHESCLPQGGCPLLIS